MEGKNKIKCFRTNVTTKASQLKFIMVIYITNNY